MTKSSAPTLRTTPANAALRSQRLRIGAAAWPLLVLALAIAPLGIAPQSAGAASICVTDTGGADDINANQKDLNEFCQSTGNDGGLSGCLAADANLTWTWDDTGWTGSNTGDACALYDTDNDGKANFALCVVVQNSPAVQASTSPVLYSCDDTKSLNCGGATARTRTSTCAVSNVADPFTGVHGTGNVCTGTNCKTRDTQAQCCVKSGDLPSTATLIDVCSYPSSSPSSSPSECVKAVLCNADSDCSALSDTCNTGTCASDGLTKRCVATPKTDGTSCDDGDLCTTGDQCSSGTCGGTAVTCTASDQCHDAGTCDATTGLCSNPAKQDGTSCNDGNLCTTNDQCTSGVCGGTAVTCTASDQCHDAGICDTTTGTCTNPAKANGSTCNDGNPCTTGETCQAGSCTGGTGKTCTALDQCHDAGTCDANGDCTNPAKADGTSCNDGNACTLNDTCQSGSCSAGTAKTCTALDQCHDAGTCDANGDCTNPPKADGTSCSDGNACTTGDTCQSGSCQSGTTKTCTALDQCHVAGTCDTSTGNCSNPNAPDGTSCTDQNACTLDDTCQSGSCVGGNGPSTTLGCKVDTGGADDAVGQKDLSEFCLNTSASCTGSVLTWQWDDTAWTGSNTGDACALYDTNNNGKANFAVCVTVTGSPAKQATQSPRVYRCGDTKQFNCTSATLITTATSTCTVNDLVTDPFASVSSRRTNKCSGTNCLTKDTQASCCVKTADLPSTAALIDVCSYPSQSPSSDPSECVKTVFCSSNADCSVTTGEGTCPGTCQNVAGVNQCVF